MSTPEELFSDAFSSIGGRLHPVPSHLVVSLGMHKKRAQDWITMVESQATESKMPEVHFDYIANGTLNAAACEVAGQAYFGVTWGTIIILGDLFCRMLSHPEVLKAIGNAAGESLDPVFQDGVVLDADALQKKRWRGAVPPRNRVWAHMPNQLVMRCQTDGLLVYQAAVARRRTRPTRPLP